MPQASQQLRDRWHRDGGQPAWVQLGWDGAAVRSTRFVNHAGAISPLPGVVPTSDDLSAISYLCDEWDYDYDPKAVASTASPTVTEGVTKYVEGGAPGGTDTTITKSWGLISTDKLKPPAMDLSGLGSQTDVAFGKVKPAGFDLAFGKDLNVAVIGLGYDNQLGKTSQRIHEILHGHVGIPEVILMDSLDSCIPRSALEATHTMRRADVTFERLGTETGRLTSMLMAHCVDRLFPTRVALERFGKKWRMALGYGGYHRRPHASRAAALKYARKMWPGVRVELGSGGLVVTKIRDAHMRTAVTFCEDRQHGKRSNFASMYAPQPRKFFTDPPDKSLVVECDLSKVEEKIATMMVARPMNGKTSWVPLTAAGAPLLGRRAYTGMLDDDGFVYRLRTEPYPDSLGKPAYAMRTREQSAALPEATKLAMLKEAKGGTWYDDWRPYCMTCSTTVRMAQHDYGFRCQGCGNLIGWDCQRLAESPLNTP